MEQPAYNPETEYLETVLRFKVYRQYVGADARDDEPWGLWMSCSTPVSYTHLTLPTKA